MLALSLLLGTCLPLLWSPPFPLHAPALIPLSLAKVRLSLTLTLSHLTIWFFEQAALFLFPFGKGGSGVLANCFLALRLLFSFQQAQYVQVFPLKPAPFCKLFSGLGSTNKSAISLLLLYESRSVLSSIFPFIAISLADPVRTVFSLLLYCQATIGPQILVSPQERRG